MYKQLPLDSYKQLVFYSSLFLTFFYLTINQLSGNGFPSDTPTHVMVIEKYFSENLGFLPHPLWHISVYLVSLFVVNVSVAAAAANSLFICAWTLGCHWVLKYYLNEKVSNNLILLLLACLLVIGPAYLPIFNPYIVLGQGSPNMWHNPTLIAVKPFAIFVTLLVPFLFTKFRVDIALGSFALFLLSLFAKPSFAIAFIPAFCMLFILKQQFSKQLTALFLLFVTKFILISYFQFTYFYAGESRGVFIDLFAVWSGLTTSIPVSIFLGLCFPLLLLLLEPKRVIKDTHLLLSWFMVLVSIVVFAVFAEKGKDYAVGNFAWSYAISTSIIYVFSSGLYFRDYESINAVKRYILLLAFAYQLCVGCFYAYRVFTGGNYL